MDDIRLTASKFSPLVISASETWLHSNIDDSLVFIPNYRIFRHDRLNQLGGGVAVWVHNTVQCTLFNVVDVPCNVNCVVLILPACKLIFISLYICPQTSVNTAMCNTISDFLVTTIDSCLLKYPSFDTIVCGDFNRFKVNLLCSTLDLVNKVSSPTRNNSFLDVFLVSTNIQNSLVVSVENPIANSDHKSLFCSPIEVCKHNWNLKRLLYDLRDFHVANFVSAVSSINWSMIICSSADVNIKCRLFHDTITDCFNSTIPRIEVAMSERDPPWFTPLLKHLINLRWSAY